MSNTQYPRIGTAVWVLRGEKVLLGKREKGSETGSWCPPGGAVDMFETPLECAIREVRDETGLTVESPKLMAVMSDANQEKGSHWITLHFVARGAEGEPRDASGEIGNWTWYSWSELPKPLFSPAGNFVKNGYNPQNFN